MVEPIFQGVNKIFDTQRISAKGYYLPNVEIKDYNMINEAKNFYQAVKDNKVTYENIRTIAIGKGDDYTTGCLLDYLYFKDSCKMNTADLSKQQALDADPRANHQINFTANLDRAGIYFILEETKETKLDFQQGTVKVL